MNARSDHRQIAPSASGPVGPWTRLFLACGRYERESILLGYSSRTRLSSRRNWHCHLASKWTRIQDVREFLYFSIISFFLIVWPFVSYSI